jgi:hypothetical protein
MRAAPPLSLAEFQDAFAHALAANPGDADARIRALVAQPAFAVYRNTVAKACVDALQANYPTVARLVGDEWFRAAAAAYVAQERPREPSLLAYGASFPSFLAAFPPASGLPYLAAVARLDRFWSEAHVAADAPVLSSARVRGVDPQALGDAILVPHPAARWEFFDDMPVYTIWRRNREQDSTNEELAWQGEGALLTRRQDVVEWIRVDAAACAFLDACASGKALGSAIGAALAVDETIDAARMVTTVLDAGAATALVPGPPPS